MRPLGEKSTSRNPEQLKLRLAMIANGWPIIPCASKSYLPKGWVTMPSTAESAKAWDDPRGGHKTFAGTGVRVEGDMLVIDLDIATKAAMDEMTVMLKRDYPAIRGGLVRSSGGTSLAIFLRVSEPVGYRRTARYGDGEVVEIFGSKVTRYFAVDGPHSVNGRVYRFLGKAPWEARLDSLPVFDAGRIGELVDKADAILGRHLARIPNSERGEDTASVAYDLEPGQTFIRRDGDAVELKLLEDSLAPGEEVRGLMSARDWAASKRKDHCKAFLGPAGNLIVFDFQEWVSHRWKAAAPMAPVELTEVGRERLKAMLDRAAGTATPIGGSVPKDEGAPVQPPAGCPFDTAVTWMVEAFAHCRGDLVMPIHDSDPGAAMKVGEFHNRYQMYSVPKAGSRTGALAYASRVWMGHRDRLSIDGFDMRPDMPFPLFDEDGKRYKNTYSPPVHAGDGETGTWLEFMRHLLPKAAEREAYLDTLAYKVQHPAIPGPAIVMVAESEDDLGDEESGTGRGMLFKVLERLFGWRYAKRLDFDIFAGISTQAVFTDWQADLVMVFVEESKETGNSRFSETRSVYEHTKALIDLDMRRGTVRTKYGRHRDAMLNFTALIATNHGNAFRIPASDRRYLVLSNGERMDERFAIRLGAWMDRPGNIAALERELRARDVSRYNPMAPPMHTEARDRMVEQGTSDIDRGVRTVVRHMLGMAFTRSQVRVQIESVLDDTTPLYTGSGQAQFNAAFRRMTVPLSVPGAKPKQERRFKVSGPQERGYARNMAVARQLDAMSHDEVRAEILKNLGDGRLAERAAAGIAVVSLTKNLTSGDDGGSEV